MVTELVLNVTNPGIIQVSLLMCFNLCICFFPYLIPQQAQRAQRTICKRKLSLSILGSELMLLSMTATDFAVVFCFAYLERERRSHAVHIASNDE